MLLMICKTSIAVRLPSWLTSGKKPSAIADDEALSARAPKALMSLIRIRASRGVTNPRNRFDVDNNGFVTARDALVLINDINSIGARPLAAASTGSSPSLRRRL